MALEDLKEMLSAKGCVKTRRPLHWPAAQDPARPGVRCTCGAGADTAPACENPLAEGRIVQHVPFSFLFTR